MTTDPWIRNGIVQRIIDGDTLVLHLDLGFRVWHETKVRLLGINAPERGEEGWALSRDNLAELAPPDSPVIARTTGPDKYGDRWLATVTTADGVDLSAAQVVRGFAVPYTGGAR